MNNKGMTFGGFVFLLIVLSIAAYLIAPLAISFVDGSNKNLFINAALSGNDYIDASEISNYTDMIEQGEARLYNFSELDVSRFDHEKFDEMQSYVLVVRNQGDRLSYSYYINFKTHDNYKDYKQIVMIKKEDVNASVITTDKNLWIKKPIIGSKITIDNKEYTVI